MHLIKINIGISGHLVNLYFKFRALPPFRGGLAEFEILRIFPCPMAGGSASHFVLVPRSSVHPLFDSDSNRISHESSTSARHPRSPCRALPGLHARDGRSLLPPGVRAVPGGSERRRVSAQLILSLNSLTFRLLPRPRRTTECGEAQ